ncbi:MAG: protein-L-isoaspartate(D-aspartate) O-methyltransferase [Candidatus Polarisedimenticolia bacterium]
MTGHRTTLLLLAASLLAACTVPPPATSSPRQETPQGVKADDAAAARERMVRTQIESRGVKDPEVLRAMRTVPRHAFVPEALQGAAHDDRPLPIGDGQTISQPYIVALMTELARPGKGRKVLEVGTGSGYQAAVLAEMQVDVYSIEILPELAKRGRAALEALGYASVHTRVGDGYAGWPEAAPFDAIVVTAAPDHVPQPLLDQLAPGGRLVIPVGKDVQSLTVFTRTADGIIREDVLPVRFVPMTGEAQRPRP